jgi:hypothetical protein
MRLSQNNGSSRGFRGHRPKDNLEEVLLASLSGCFLQSRSDLLRRRLRSEAAELRQDIGMLAGGAVRQCRSDGLRFFVCNFPHSR